MRRRQIPRRTQSNRSACEEFEYCLKANGKHEKPTTWWWRIAFECQAGAALDSLVRNRDQPLDGFGERGYPLGAVG